VNNIFRSYGSLLISGYGQARGDESKTRLALSVDGINWKNYNKNLFNGHDAEILKINDTLTYAYYGPNGYFDRKDCDIRLVIFEGEFDEQWNK